MGYLDWKVHNPLNKGLQRLEHGKIGAGRRIAGTKESSARVSAGSVWAAGSIYTGTDISDISRYLLFGAGFLIEENLLVSR